MTPVTSSPSTKTWVDLQVAVGEHRCPRPERSLGDAAVARDHVGGKDVVGDEPLALAVEARCQLVEAPTGPWRQRRVVQHPGGGTRRGPRRRRRGGRLLEAAECRPWEGSEREHGRLPPQDLRASGSAPSPSPRPRRRCASDQRRSSGTRRRRAASRARDGRRRPRPPPRRPLSRGGPSTSVSPSRRIGGDGGESNSPSRTFRRRPLRACPMICRRPAGRPSAGYRSVQSRAPRSGLTPDYATLVRIAASLSDASTTREAEVASTLTLPPKRRGRESTGGCQVLRFAA